LRGKLGSVVAELAELERQMVGELRREVDAAFAFAEESPFPASEEAFVGEYA
jgi:TPP-dependent pyruvate/acetoin dehydrogenase alpha subunit